MDITKYIYAFLIFASICVFGATGFAMAGRNHTAASAPLEYVPPVNYTTPIIQDAPTVNYTTPIIQDAPTDYANEETATFPSSIPDSIGELEPIAEGNATEVDSEEPAETEISNGRSKRDTIKSWGDLVREIIHFPVYLLTGDLTEFNTGFWGTAKDAISRMEWTRGHPFQKCDNNYIPKAKDYLDAAKKKYKESKRRKIDAVPIEGYLKFRLLDIKDMCSSKYTRLKKYTQLIYKDTEEKYQGIDDTFKSEYPSVEDLENVNYCRKIKSVTLVKLADRNFCHLQEIRKLYNGYEGLGENISRMVNDFKINRDLHNCFGAIFENMFCRLEAMENYLLGIGREKGILTKEIEDAIS